MTIHVWSRIFVKTGVMRMRVGSLLIFYSTVVILLLLGLKTTVVFSLPTTSTTTESDLLIFPEDLPNNINSFGETTIKSNINVEKGITFDVPTPGIKFNLTVGIVMDSMIELSWPEPIEQRHRPIQEQRYRVTYVQENNFTRFVIVTQNNVKLLNLVPFTKYKIWVESIQGNEKKINGISNVHMIQTDVGPPQPPLILSISCQSENALLLVLKSPTHYNNTIDFFYVNYRKENTIRFDEKEIEAQMGQKTLILKNLTTNTVYEVKVRASTRSIVETNKVYMSKFSESHKIRMAPDCVPSITPRPKVVEQPETESEFTPVMIFVTVAASFLLILLVIAMFIWRRRCFQGAYYYLDDHLRLPPLGTGIGWEGDNSDGFKQVIPIHMFPKHVADLHVDGDIGFSKEYESIQVTSSQDEYSSEHSHHPDNKLKNRYLNIVAYDHSLVRLYPLSGSKKMVEYVNANYIDGFQKARAYIATQGPLPSTFDSFWRIVWEHNVHIIVMITNLVERGRKKCDMYWPKEGVETYGVVQVRLVKEENMATYTVRVFQLRNMKKKKKQNIAERTVYHYHYTNWPDHGTPSHPLPVLSFVQKSSLANPPDGGPIIVHCSAGVGRTGTYIVLDAMLRQIRARGDLNVFGYLQYIRTQRNFLVQTEEQYIFIHDALLEAIESGDTNVSRNCLTRYINSLLTGTFADEKCEESSLLERQFKLVTQFCPKEFHISAAQKPCNIAKNRNQEYICCDAYRVLLTPKPGVEGSDYINASFLPGFLRLQEFILTQHPLESTTASFWQMLCDHNVQTLVVLSVVDDGDYRAFWPTATEDLVLDTFRVKLLEESDRVGYVLREFSIESLQDDDELSVKMIQSSHWPHHCASSLRSVFELLQMVEESINETHIGPIVVVDKFGGLEGASFCALSALIKQLELESHIDIYMYAKLYHEQRPGVWKTLEDYLFLYRSLEELLTGRRNSDSTPCPGSPSPLTDGDDSLRVLTQPATELTEVSTANDRWSPEVDEENENNANENDEVEKQLVTVEDQEHDEEGLIEEPSIEKETESTELDADPSL